jgi:hypothetical protein
MQRIHHDEFLEIWLETADDQDEGVSNASCSLDRQTMPEVPLAREHWRRLSHQIEKERVSEQIPRNE